jgi:U3 small nucleolar RNA-associated protein 4
MPAPTDQAYHSTIPLHRIRFYDHTPSPITALAFSPLPLPPARDPASKGKAKEDGEIGGTGSNKVKEEFGVLVLCRDNGNVEIWEHVIGDHEGAYGNWVLSKVSRERKIRYHHD